MIETYCNHFGFECLEYKKLDGYISENYLVHSATDEKYILKVYPHTEDILLDLKAETNLLLALQDKLPYQITRPIIKHTPLGLKVLEEGKILRLISYLEGRFWHEQVPLNEAFLFSLGRSMGQMDLALKEIEPGFIKHRNLVWDAKNYLQNKPLIQHIKSPLDQKYILHFFDQFERQLDQHRSQLRVSLIHNDFNDWNVLVTNDQLTGLIDFGDLVYSFLIAELAVAISYALCYSENLLADASKIIEAYHQVLPLKKVELDLLYLFIAGRIGTSLTNSAKATKDNPENEYISVSAQGYQKLLHRWIEINPIRFKNMAYKACGFEENNPSQTKKKIRGIRKNHFSAALSLSYRDPIFMDSAAFQYMYDLEGNSYLDAYNNIPLVGHAHPRISAALYQQSSRLNTNTRYHYQQLGDYATKLLEHFPNDLNQVFFVNSGSAASDLAVRLARNFTQRKDLVVLAEGYHGNTQLGIEISPYKHNHHGGQGPRPYIHALELPKVYGSGLSSDAWVRKGEDQLEKLFENKILPAAFIGEPISGCGGQVPMPPKYLEKIYAKTRSQGGLCIADEVQIGFGRLGNWFWGFEMQEVTPDIVILGKPMGNGHPLAAVVTTREISQAFDNGMEFFSSFGGNPVSCAVGLEVLDILEDEKLMDNAHQVGHYWKQALEQLKNKYPNIGDVRGAGLFLGIEIVNHQGPDTIFAERLKNKMKEKYILTSTDGPDNNVIKVKPPLCFSKANVDQFMTQFEILLLENASW